MAEVPSLVNMYKDITSDSMSFEMIAIESQNSGMDKVSDFVINKNINYPVAVSGTVAGYSGSGIPARLLFDHTGKLIHQSKGAMGGSTMAAIEEAIKNAPHPLTGGYAYKKLSKEAKMVRGNVGWGKVLAKLRKITANVEADADELHEAGIMLPLLEGHANKLLKRAENMIATNPVLAVQSFISTQRLFKGDEIADKAKERMKTVTSDANYKKEEKAWGTWRSIEQVYKKYGLKNKSKNKQMYQGCELLMAKFEGCAGTREAGKLHPKLLTALGGVPGGSGR